MEIHEIFWKDITSRSGWMDSSVNFNCLNIHSIGYLLKVDEDTVTIAQSKVEPEEEQISATLTILKVNIIKMNKLTPKGWRKVKIC